MDIGDGASVVLAVLALCSLWVAGRQAKRAGEQAEFLGQQIEQANELHEASRRPYLTVAIRAFEEPGKSIGLFIENSGVSPASDVFLEIDPPPHLIVGDGIDHFVRGEVTLPVIDLIPPGGVWATTLGYGPAWAAYHNAKEGGTPPKSYSAHIAYCDPFSKREYEGRFDLTWSGLEQWHPSQTDPTEKSLKDIAATLRSWSERHPGKGLRVSAHDGAAVDEANANWKPRAVREEKSDQAEGDG